MKGEELYAMYVKSHSLQNSSVDPWDELDETDQWIWNHMANQLMEG